jgi:hypothetical protein
MYLLEIFLPLADNSGSPFAPACFDKVRSRLAEKFGGVTAFTRAPAEGTETRGGHQRSDELIVFEVMSESLDEAWWTDYRKSLDADFRQHRILIRASTITLL